jgi:hypothetical protein
MSNTEDQDLVGLDGVHLGPLSEFLERAAKQPESLAAFYSWTESLRRSLPLRLVETVELTVVAHIRGDLDEADCERRSNPDGLTSEEIQALRQLRAGACASFDDSEVAAAALARCLLDDFGRGCNSAVIRLSRLIGEPATTACLMLAAREVAQATLANAWGLGPNRRRTAS